MNAEKNGHEDNTTALAQGIAILIAVICVLSPGMLFVAAFSTVLHLDLDAGQLWTFSVLSSVALFALTWFVCHKTHWDVNGGRAGAVVTAMFVYGGVSFAIPAVCLILYFGFKVQTIGYWAFRFLALPWPPS